ncbi:MAG: dihydroorotase [Thermomicrobiales bacterium]
MTESSWLIKGGHVVDPANAFDSPADVLVRSGQIEAVGSDLNAAGVPVVDASGLVVAPGLIDLHVHLREPGFEHKETIATGTAAAAAGGFTSICCMPNTQPALDSVEALDDLRARVARHAVVRVFPIGAITINRAGEEAVDFPALAAAGAIGFSDDGDTTRDSGIMRQALEWSRELGFPIMVHCEDNSLALGAMNEGEVSRLLCISGIPPEAEEIIIARDIILARLTGGWLHLCHVSTARGAAMARAAKSEGLSVTAEVMPHHLVMTDEWVAGSRSLVNVVEPAGKSGTPGDPDTKVNPPLRTLPDAKALLASLVDGTFDIVATDHAPHATTEKQGRSFEDAPFGLSGLEFALPSMLALVRAGHLSLRDLIYRLSTVPARLLRIKAGALTPGFPADVVIFDQTATWRVEAGTLRSKSANTPLLGMELTGRVVQTLVDGEVRFDG